MRTTKERARDAILGSFVADSAATGLHWIYDQAEVRRLGGDEPEFQPPENNQFHSKRNVGQYTHYGDHALVALESLVERGGLDSDDYRDRYIARFSDSGYDGYLDHATKDLLASHKGADDNQAGCFAKLPVMVARYLEDPEFEARIEEAVRVTHENTQAVRYSVSAACAIQAAIRGGTAPEAVSSVCARSRAVSALVEKVLGADADMVAFALATGQTCPVPNAFPVALHAALLARDFKDAVRASIWSGGDTSGRLYVTAAIRGATDGVPEDWAARLAGRAEIGGLIERLLEKAALKSV
ncbi:MAG: ADP-ribosylglycohydrolase family protein [Planctomycetota bacterium]|nr:ADP-ribosylglycohydrolase family protein [Planctomycetota bacterium]